MPAATAGAAQAAAFVEKFNDIILFPLITLLVGIALLYFIYGCVTYIMNAENSTARETGRSHIIYGILGMLIMLIAYAILTIAANTFGLNDVLDCSKDPLKAGCDNVMRVPGSGEYSDGIDDGGGSGDVDDGTIDGAVLP